MILVRKGNTVFFKDRKLTINAQATKGPGKEVVKIDGLEGSNGQKWVSLNLLKEGSNDIDCKGREVNYSNSSKKVEYRLTEAEQKEIDELKSKIESIIEKAKERYIPVPDLNVDPSTLTEEERLEKLAEVERYLKSMKG